MKLPQTFRRMTALLLAAALLLAGCGGGTGTGAASMKLKRAEGTVGVLDAEGAALEPKENLGLYSGYRVDTETESYAWIDLDSVKLAKLDQNSEIALNKEEKSLTVEVLSGSLFFNVTEPLAADETMEIRTSSMLVGIRGTCGWVERSEDGQQLKLYLLEGQVECAAGENTATVNAGEMAVLTDGGEIAAAPFLTGEIPAFVRAEVEPDETLNEAIREASGIDVAASSHALYAEQSFARLGEILYTDVLDFEGDGSPELLIVYRRIWNDVPELHWRVYREESESAGGLDYDIGNSGESDLFQSVSLAECDGRLFMMEYHIPADFHLTDEYTAFFGSTALQDGDSSAWRSIDTVFRNPIRPDGEFFWGIRSGESIPWENQSCTAAEYEAVLAKHHVLRTLACSPLGSTEFIVLPNPLEMGEIPTSDA